MPAIASVSLVDSAGSPVTHVFSPESINSASGKTLASWVDRSSGVIVGYWRIRLETAPRNATGMFKQRFILERATLETLSNNTSSGINPAPTLAYRTTGAFELWAHERSLAVERGDVIKMMCQALGGVAATWANTGLIPTALQNIEAIY
jgi:hypothetical protein